MGNMTRRKFIRGTIVMAAGAAAGLTAYKGFREHGPVDIKFYLFSKDPVVVKSSLFSDERRDIFGMRMLEAGHWLPAFQVEMPLSRIRRILSSAYRGGACPVTVYYRGGRTERTSMVVAAESEKFTVRFDPDPTPVWLQLSDVRRVL
jgi:hypothetical protein